MLKLAKVLGLLMLTNCRVNENSGRNDKRPKAVAQPLFGHLRLLRSAMRITRPAISWCFA